MKSDACADTAPAPTLESVYHEHFGFICRALRGLGVSSDAIDDAAQEMLFVVHRRLSEFEPQTSLRGWLFRIASHVASNHRRSTRRRHQRERESVETVLRSPGPEAAIEGKQAFQLVEQFLATLDEGHRAVFVLVLMEQLPATEVAAALELPVNTVYSRVHVLRRCFRSLLAHHYQEGSR